MAYLVPRHPDDKTKPHKPRFINKYKKRGYVMLALLSIQSLIILYLMGVHR